MDNYLRAIDRTISIYGNLMLKNPNIVAVGRGNKTTNGKMIKNRPTITIFVKRKLTNSVIEKSLRIPRYIKGIETDVYERKIDSKLEKSSDVKLISDLKPAFGGGSIGVFRGSQVKISTLTYAFTNEGQRDKLYALTSAHTCTLGKNPIKPGGKIFYFRGNNKKDFDEAWELGRFVQSKTQQYMENDIDAALIYVGQNNPKGKNLIAPGLLNGKIITSTHTITQDDITNKEKVYRIGMMTGYTEGKILTIKTMIKVAVDEGKRIIINKNQINTDIISKDGDSGALGVMKRTQKAFGISNTAIENESAFSEIDTVLKAFDIEFLT